MGSRGDEGLEGGLGRFLIGGQNHEQKTTFRFRFSFSFSTSFSFSYPPRKNHIIFEITASCPSGTGSATG